MINNHNSVHGLDVGCQASEAEEELVADGKVLWELIGDHQGLGTETLVRADGYTVLANHGNQGTTIILCNALKQE